MHSRPNIKRPAAARGAFFDTQGIDPNGARAADCERAITAHCNLLAGMLDTTPAESDAVRSLLASIMEFIGAESFRSYHPQYRRGNFYQETLTHCSGRLADARKQTASWLEAVNDFEGRDSVPVMTIHKSKGLEYHTILFIGLEDSALWSFRRAPVDETCTFFVAFSRAISRVIFTFSKLRPDRRTSNLEGQSRNAIDSLYGLLKQAGVTEEHYENPGSSPSDPSDILL